MRLMPDDMQLRDPTRARTIQNGRPAVASAIRAAQRSANHCIAARPLAIPCLAHDVAIVAAIQTWTLRLPSFVRMYRAEIEVGASEPTGAVLEIGATPAWTGIAVRTALEMWTAVPVHATLGIDVGDASPVDPQVTPYWEVDLRLGTTKGVGCTVHWILVTLLPSCAPWGPL